VQEGEDGQNAEGLQHAAPDQQGEGLGVDQADQQAVRGQDQDSQGGQQQALLVVGPGGLGGIG